jgi:hypothetical protein
MFLMEYTGLPLVSYHFIAEFHSDCIIFCEGFFDAILYKVCWVLFHTYVIFKKLPNTM